uniref:Uncharacterized protein n=1 Tax=Meloidogyne enterolobii TaxID=390850 RepID=A0A6V7VSZ5_MELEN|nr:unnamed protein product [Meloidogyne enterolobii]
MLKYLSIFICIFNFVLIQAILNTNLNNRNKQQKSNIFRKAKLVPAATIGRYNTECFFTPVNCHRFAEREIRVFSPKKENSTEKQKIQRNNHKRRLHSIRNRRL